MRKERFVKAVVFCLLMALVVPLVQGSARSSSSSSRRGGLYGDWEVKIKYDGREMTSILYFSRDKEGKRIGQWLSFWGVSELQDFTYEEGKLSFSRVSRSREGQPTTSKFTGTIKDGKLSGMLTSDRGEYKLEGKPSKRIPRVVGSWAMKFKIGEREITSTLVIKADKEDKLTGQWQSAQGEHKVTDVEYERGKLTFKRTSKIEEREFESTFDGSIQWQTDTLAGVFKSERGEIPAEATRIGAPIIGTWNLEIESESGNRKQRLLVNRDMTGLYGAMPIKKVNLEGDKVTFKIVLEFGERKFEMNFAGKLAEGKLTGELKTSRGSQKITGVKVVRTFRRRTGSSGAGSGSSAR